MLTVAHSSIFFCIFSKFFSFLNCHRSSWLRLQKIIQMSYPCFTLPIEAFPSSPNFKMPKSFRDRPLSIFTLKKRLVYFKKAIPTLRPSISDRLTPRSLMTAHFIPKKVNFELDLSRAFQNEVASFRILSRSAKPFINFYSGFQIFLD